MMFQINMDKIKKTIMDNTSKSILMQVGFKGAIELAKHGKANPHIKGLEETTLAHYQMLTSLINKAIKTDELAQNSDIETLERLIDSSTLDSDQRVKVTATLTPELTYGNYIEIRNKLLLNQLPATDSPGGKTQFAINQALKKEGK